MSNLSLRKKSAGFKPVDPKVDFPKLEEEILEYWKKNKIFEKSVESRPKDKRWTFLDGPPFVTGLPHYGHLLGSIHKDVFGRYWTMKGYRVPRLWGWDGHGLPVENKVENKLEIKRKKDIEDVIGVKRFIDECRRYVEQISEEWEWYIDHIGRWVGFKNAYKTWDRIVHCVTNPESKSYLVGILLYSPWKEFSLFLEDVGHPPHSEMAFIRLDKDKGFFPNNCVWVSRSDASKINAAWMKRKGTLTGRPPKHFTQ